MPHAGNYAQAKDHAKAKYAFFVHAIVYVAVMLVLVITNMLTSPENNWSIWPFLGWGIAVALHGARVFMSANKNTIVDALTEDELKRSNANKSEGGR